MAIKEAHIMLMPQSILVVISGKHKEHEALQRALTFAEHNNTHIHLLNVMFEPVTQLIDVFSIEHCKEMKRQCLAERFEYLNAIALDLGKKGIKCTVQVEWEPEIQKAIKQVVDELEPDLVIKRISADQLSINPFALPIDRYLLRFCDAPLLLVKHSNWTASPILAAVDVLATDEQHIELNKDVLESAKLIAHLSSSELHVVSSYITHSVSAAIDFSNIDLDTINANSARYHQEKLNSLELEQLVDNNKNHVLAGVPEQAIPNVTKQINAQLVVLGTVARKGMSGALIGNTVESVLAELNCEVLVVKHKAL
tara:strand:- start:100 stop:1032 length:933 start_codon:yes stop_codon:yes gene_type:complete